MRGLRRLWEWLDDRAGVARLWRAFADAPLPGGARWARVFGTALLATFALQAVTGVLLAFYYSPSATDAWASVYFIQYQVTGGWLLRGLHHWGSSALIVLVVAHCAQTFVYGAHKAPRELNWMVGVLLAFLILGLGFTGYLLPWDQRAFAATRVATNIIASTPLVGAALDRLVVGGSDFGNLTLTRFFALHAFVLPGLVVALSVAHLYLYRRKGATPPPWAGKATLARVDTYWPQQAARDAFFMTAVLVVVAAVVFAARGARLDAPADPSSNYLARPEWYYMALFQLLKYFEGPLQPIGTVVLPGLASLLALALPFLDRGPERRAANGGLKPALAFVAPALLAVALNLAGFGSPGPRDVVRLLWAVVLPTAAVFALVGWSLWKMPEPDSGPEAAAGRRGRWTVLVFAGLGAVVAFTALAIHEDALDPAVAKARPEADAIAARAVALAAGGVPPGGGPALWESDPMTNGARVFVEHCQQCHKLAGEGGDRAPELMGWARREWLVAVMRLAEEPRLFGPTKMRLMPPYDGPGEAEALAEYMLAEGGEKAVDAALVAKGKKLFADKECKNCHLYAGEGRDYGTPGPELKGYATAGWLEEFVHDPGGEKFFGPLNEMPKFGEKLTHKEIDDVVAYVLATRGEAMGPRHALTTPPPAAPASAPASEPASTPASAPASTPASAPAPAPAP